MLRTPNEYKLDLFTRSIKDFNGKDISAKKPSFVRGDVDAYKLKFKLTDNEEAVSLVDRAVLIAFKRANSTVMIDDDVIITNAATGECEYTVKSDAIAVPGKLLFELYIYSGSSRITAPSINAVVIDDIDNSDVIPTTNEYPILAQLLEKTRVFAAGSFHTAVVIVGVSSDIFISPFAGYGLTHWALYIDGIRVSNVIAKNVAVRVNIPVLSNISALTVRMWNTANPPDPDAPWSDNMFQPWDNNETWGQWLDDNTFQVEAAFHPFVNSTIEDGAGNGLLVS